MRCLATDVLLLRALARAGMGLPSRCLEMGLYVKILVDITILPRMVQASIFNITAQNHGRAYQRIKYTSIINYLMNYVHHKLTVSAQPVRLSPCVLGAERFPCVEELQFRRETRNICHSDS
jgi:hypothetical protein